MTFFFKSSRNWIHVLSTFINLNIIQPSTWICNVSGPPPTKFQFTRGIFNLYEIFMLLSRHIDQNLLHILQKCIVLFRSEMLIKYKLSLTSKKIVTFSIIISDLQYYSSCKIYFQSTKNNLIWKCFLILPLNLSASN